MDTDRAPWLLRLETFLLTAAVVLTLAGIGVFYGLRATTLTIAVAPRDGTEPELIRAFADALQTQRRPVRLNIRSYDDVRDSAQALGDGAADLAVVRPDVLLPGNALTLAILRDQAMLVAAPEGTGVKAFPDLARRRLGIISHRDADFDLLKTLLAYYGLDLVADPAAFGARNSTLLINVPEADVTVALKEKRVDAVVAIIAPSAPRALILVDAVKAASRDGRVAFLASEDDDALIERFPRQQAVTIPTGLFGGRPKVPADDVKTLGASYRLMAASSMSRSVAADVTQGLFELRNIIAERTAAADYIKAPDYETTAAATSAVLPNHPGAIDYYEREQLGFVDRYGDLIYLLAFLAGGVGSASAWLRQRLTRLKRERADVVLDRLLEIVAEARGAAGLDSLSDLHAEIDALAVDFARDARAREVDSRTVGAVEIAIGAARSAVTRVRASTGRV